MKDDTQKAIDRGSVRILVALGVPLLWCAGTWLAKALWGHEAAAWVCIGCPVLTLVVGFVAEMLSSGPGFVSLD